MKASDIAQASAALSKFNNHREDWKNFQETIAEEGVNRYFHVRLICGDQSYSKCIVDDNDFEELVRTLESVLRGEGEKARGTLTALGVDPDA